MCIAILDSVKSSQSKMSVTQKISTINSLINMLKTNISFRTLTTSNALMKAEDRKQMLASLPARDEGKVYSTYLRFYT